MWSSVNFGTCSKRTLACIFPPALGLLRHPHPVPAHMPSLPHQGGSQHSLPCVVRSPCESQWGQEAEIGAIHSFATISFTGPHCVPDVGAMTRGRHSLCSQDWPSPCPQEGQKCSGTASGKAGKDRWECWNSSAPSPPGSQRTGLIILP